MNAKSHGRAFCTDDSECEDYEMCEFVPDALQELVEIIEMSMGMNPENWSPFDDVYADEMDFEIGHCVPI